MFKEYEELSDSDLYDLRVFIDNLYNLSVYEVSDYLYIKNRLRHIMEILLTDEVYNGIMEKDKKDR